METTNQHDQRLGLGNKIASALIKQGKDALAQESELNWLNNFQPGKRFFRGKAYKTVMRIMDLTFVIASMPFWLPLIGMVYLAIIVTSPGAQAIFIQKRTGRNGKRFNLYNSALWFRMLNNSKRNMLI